MINIYKVSLDGSADLAPSKYFWISFGPLWNIYEDPWPRLCLCLWSTKSVCPPSTGYMRLVYRLVSCLKRHIPWKLLVIERAKDPHVLYCWGMLPQCRSDQCTTTSIQQILIFTNYYHYTGSVDKWCIINFNFSSKDIAHINHTSSLNQFY